MLPWATRPEPTGFSHPHYHHPERDAEVFQHPRLIPSARPFLVTSLVLHGLTDHFSVVRHEPCSHLASLLTFMRPSTLAGGSGFSLLHFIPLRGLEPSPPRSVVRPLTGSMRPKVRTLTHCSSSLLLWMAGSLRQGHCE